MIDLHASLITILPELWLALAAMALLLWGAFAGDKAFGAINGAGVLVCFGAMALLIAQPSGTQEAFGGLFISDAFARFLKLLVLAATAAALLLSRSYLEQQKIAKPEYPVLILLATLGMAMMISAHNFLALYLGLELQSLALYVLASFHRDNDRSSEAGLKYFVLGALSSGLLLYGCSLIYGFTGSVSFAVVETAIAGAQPVGLGIIVGMVFVLAGLAFKISAVPFHMWAPDVYEGAPTPVTAFFAAAPKVAAMGLLIRVLMEPFGAAVAQWQQIIVVLAAASMALGAVAAIGQSNIKRLLAYSSIGHVGYALVGVSAASEAGLRSVLVYLAIYITMTLGAFLCVLLMRRDGEQVENIEDLGGLAQTQPRLALALAVLMFSLAGVPLLAGFFGKLYVFMAAMEAGLYGLAVFGVLASVVSAYYYLRVVKILYFDAPVGRFDRGSATVGGLLTLCALLSSPLSFAYIAPLLDAALGAARALIS